METEEFEGKSKDSKNIGKAKLDEFGEAHADAARTLSKMQQR